MIKITQTVPHELIVRTYNSPGLRLQLAIINRLRLARQVILTCREKLYSAICPPPDKIKEHKFLSVFGQILHDPQLWHLTRYSVGHAFSVGLFCAFIPVPFQMLLAAGGAILFRANIAISVALVWITNPLTMPLFFGFAYLVGLTLLGQDSNDFYFELSFNWLSDNLTNFWQPFLLGCLICASISATLGYVGVRIFWRLHIANAWQTRKRKRQVQK